MVRTMDLLKQRRKRLRKGTCRNCGSFPCVDGMDRSRWELRGRKLVEIRTTEREQREYFASLLSEQGCQSWSPKK